MGDAERDVKVVTGSIGQPTKEWCTYGREVLARTREGHAPRARRRAGDGR